jgi:hypothetical protein
VDKQTKAFVARCHNAMTKRDEREMRACLASIGEAGGKAKNLATSLLRALSALHKR